MLRTQPSVVKPQLGTNFDSFGEACDFCNLCLCENGFGVREKLGQRRCGRAGVSMHQWSNNYRLMTTAGTWQADKAPYEWVMSERTRFCGICHKPGHKRTTCPERSDEPKLLASHRNAQDARSKVVVRWLVEANGRGVWELKACL